MSISKAVPKLILLAAMLLVPAFLQASPAQAYNYKLFSPRAYVEVPANIQACQNCKVDARILNDVKFIAEHFKLKVSQGRAPYPPSLTHGAGTSVDFVSSKRQNLYSAYVYLGGQGAIKSVQYGKRSTHLHVTWKSSARLNGKLVKPARWVRAISKPSETSCLPTEEPTLAGGCQGRPAQAATASASTRKVFSPRVYKRLPKRLALNRDVVDARIIGNVSFLVRKFGMTVTQGRAGSPPSLTHGSGTAVDFVPLFGTTWNEMKKPLRYLKNQGAINYVSLEPGSHLHVSWKDSYGNPGDGKLRPPARWVKVFG